MSDTAAAPTRARRSRESAPPPPAVEVRADESGPLGPVSPERVRKPLGRHRTKLDNSERAGFHRHWFNDDKGRIQDALDAGYKHVNDEMGKPMSKIVGAKSEGGPLLAYRMEIPIEWWQQDQDEKVVARRKRQEEMKRGVTGSGAPGQDGRYQPVDAAKQPISKIETSAR